MKPEIERAMREVLEAWETPDSPEALAAAMYQMKRVHRAAVEDAKSRRKPGRPRKYSRHNVKEHAPPPAGERSETGVEVQATLDSADKAAGGGCRASACSPSSLFAGDSESSKELIGKVQFFRDGTWAAYGAVDQTICSLPEYHAQSTNSSLDL